MVGFAKLARLLIGPAESDVQFGDHITVTLDLTLPIRTTVYQLLFPADVMQI